MWCGGSIGGRPRGGVSRIASALIAGSALLLAGRAPTAGAAITAVEISLTSVQAFAGSQALLLRFEGAILGSSLVQVDYPLHLVVFEPAGGRYVRYDVSTGAVSGTAPQLLDGATSQESLDLLSEGTPLAGARVVFVGEGRVDVLLPAGALAGPLDAYAFAFYRGAALLSNTLPVEGTQP